MKMCLKLEYCAFSSSPSKDATMSTFVVFLHYFLEFKPFDELFPFQNVIANLSVFVARVCVCVCVCIHSIKTSAKLSLALFISAIFKKR